MKSKDIILKALERERKKERGLRIIKPNVNLAIGYMNKANHNLVVMTDLNNLGHSDWVVISAYYAMYNAATSILAKLGLDSKDHATTVAILEYFFSERVDRDFLERFNELKKRKDKIEQLKIEEKYIDYIWKIKETREIVQYGITTVYKETDLVVKYARDFVSKMKLVVDGIDEDVIAFVRNEIKLLQSKIK